MYDRQLIFRTISNEEKKQSSAYYLKADEWIALLKLLQLLHQRQRIHLQKVKLYTAVAVLIQTLILWIIFNRNIKHLYWGPSFFKSIILKLLPSFFEELLPLKKKCP